ncbi:hypothetical protein COCON_G00196200, partial [Conger conger]
TNYSQTSDSDEEDISRRKISLKRKSCNGRSNKATESDTEKDRRESEDNKHPLEVERLLSSEILGYPSPQDPPLGLDFDETQTRNSLGRSPSRDLCGEEWANEKPGRYLDEAVQSQIMKAVDEMESETTYGEVEQRLDLLQEHLNRLESQMTSDIQTILQLLHRQLAHGPPTYSMVTASPEYQRPCLPAVPTSGTEQSFSSGSAQSNEFLDLQKPQQKSKESPSGMETNSEDHVATLLGDVEPHHRQKQNQSAFLHQQRPKSLQLPSPNPSVPDSLSNVGMLGLQRQASDPGLPWK